MIIECPACRSRYQYDEDRFERKPSKKIKCARCKEVFEIRNPAFEEKKSAPRGDATAPSPHESTRTRTSRPAIETKEEEPAAEPERGANQAPLQMPSGRRLSLALLDGPDAGKVFRIEKPNITIGRAGADLNLNDTEASRLHAGIEIRDTFYLLSDLGSTNGTIYAGEKLTGAVELADKAEFQVGVTTLMLIVTEEF